ncbi:DUF6712 family protein [Leyella stercorea]|uniref:DUF6712 family protein n=1 Tax=Leyella stercorea TaxID=363265 RepID=UPI0025848209|nr:DUF6712 family protein [Leyella stercorea]
MSYLINDNKTLRKYVPNTLKAVAGELSLFDKIQYHLLQAEQWQVRSKHAQSGSW